jgi:hypothetical protein
MGDEGQRIATREASADLGGDPKFSGWAPTLATRLRRSGETGLMLSPTRQSAGPWTVAEQGRNAHGGFRNLFQGPALNMRTGRTSRRRDGSLNVRARRTRVARRYNGVTQGKGTATRAASAMERRAIEVADEMSRAHFRGARVDVD